MQRILLAGATALTILVVSQPAPAAVPSPHPTPDRVVLADTVILGKVTSIEDKPVMARRFPLAKEKTEHKVAVVQVTDGLKGAKGLTHIRLGFVTPVPPKVVPWGEYTPTVGQEGCFFLSKHYEGEFHVARINFDVIDKKARNFDKDLFLISRCAKLMDDPNAGLKSKDAEDRLLTARMLLTYYRIPKAGEPNSKTEPVDAEQSKLILEAIATADWDADYSRFSSGKERISPLHIFHQLKLRAGDGWNPPKFKDQKEFPPFAQQWLKDNADKYRLQRYVR